MRHRKSDSPQKAALREMMARFMKDNNINVKDGNNVKTATANTPDFEFSKG